MGRYDIWRGLTKEETIDLRRAIKRWHIVEYRLKPEVDWQVVYFFRGTPAKERVKLVFGRILPAEREGPKREQQIRWRIDGRVITATDRDRRDWRKLKGIAEPKASRRKSRKKK